MSTSGLDQYGPVGYVGMIAVGLAGGAFVVRRWQHTTREAGDSLRGEYLSRVCGLLFVLAVIALFVLMPGAALVGVDLPGSVVRVLAYGMFACAVVAALSGVVSWVERRGAARRDAQLGITDVKPRRLTVGTVAYLGAAGGLVLGVLIAFAVMMLIWVIDPGAAFALFVERPAPIWLFVMVLAITALCAGAAGYWQNRRRN
ncbi:hypothetical protein Ae168Ps1_6336c [Pseudonocardia sp. Ae168_Ps1]|uniref:hypothetical protein n=1 Tax=unclassified Pseudonocardia TaxID=2619320 RepID=UPI0009691801|nr:MULTISPECIES: hypothetical protein [unclassified Pseudonocardia]OLL69922.1 hypothetical protein Ae150APs1_6232 [Pseudonocardia sp. Ae150A_Ps1]OLL70099.1 hypothetical protein Ae168Ps1_6336c [Pseudonocardia sp. Ae168_Ps1]OLL70370.1 hypothetical protein Ae263Ps1_6314c [Pseudonocardia sp. Ae263_Ps1]OLL89151.1 hypothetical protein Ae356Ps1_6179c [Pseudonocardia sp. Ae356_Ps1]